MVGATEGKSRHYSRIKLADRQTPPNLLTLRNVLIITERNGPLVSGPFLSTPDVWSRPLVHVRGRLSPDR
jgi:hypothetical protein